MPSAGPKWCRRAARCTRSDAVPPPTMVARKRTGAPGSPSCPAVTVVSNARTLTVEAWTLSQGGLILPFATAQAPSGVEVPLMRSGANSQSMSFSRDDGGNRPLAKLFRIPDQTSGSCGVIVGDNGHEAMDALLLVLTYCYRLSTFHTP